MTPTELFQRAKDIVSHPGAYRGSITLEFAQHLVELEAAMCDLVGREDECVSIFDVGDPYYRDLYRPRIARVEKALGYEGSMV